MTICVANNRCRQVLWLWVCGVATAALLTIASSAAA
jgi:hypothetical protein